MQTLPTLPILPLAASRTMDSFQALFASDSWRDSLEFWCYRVGAYLVLNVVEDPAWLALAFC